MKKLLILLFFIMITINSSAKIFVPDGIGGYKSRNDISESLSTYGICKNLGYEKEMFYSLMNLDNDSDIFQVCFKIFTEDIICVFTNDNVQEITEQDVTKFLKDKDYDFNREYSMYNRESDLLSGIKSRTLKIAFLSDVMEFDYNISETDTMIISEKFGYKLYFKNGILYKFESADGLNKWAREWKELYPNTYNMYYEKSKLYWGDDKEKILKDINIQATSHASISSDLMKNISLFKDESGYINYKILMVYYFNDSISMREFKDITYGEYKYIGESKINKTGIEYAYTYEYQFWLFSFSKDGKLVSRKLKKL